MTFHSYSDTKSFFLCSHTYDKIEAESERLWRYHMYGLVHEYYHMPWLPPPVNLIGILTTAFLTCASYVFCAWRCCKSCGTCYCVRCCRSRLNDYSHFRKFLFDFCLWWDMCCLFLFLVSFHYIKLIKLTNSLESLWPYSCDMHIRKGSLSWCAVIFLTW